MRVMFRVIAFAAALSFAGAHAAPAPKQQRSVQAVEQADFTLFWY